MFDFLIHSDFSVLLIAGAAAVVVTSLVLLTGWFTRTAAVTMLSVGLGLAAGSLLGLFLFLRVQNGASYELIEIVAFRLIASAGALVVLVGVWGTIRLWRSRPRSRSVPTGSQRAFGPDRVEYNREWLLSQLQAQVASSSEKVATNADGPAGPSDSPPR